VYKYMATHHVEPGAFTRDQVCELADAAQHEDHVTGYRSFLNLTEGKVICVLEAESADAVAAWFKKMGLPYDDITLVELEGERGAIHDALPTGVSA
jgi:hypothetical protein